MATINRVTETEEYKALLDKHRPALVTTDEQYESYCDAIEHYMALSNAGTITPAEDAMYDLLCDLVEKYQEKEAGYSDEWAGMSPHEVLAYLMEENGLKQADLIGILGNSSGAVSQIVSGTRAIPADKAKKLAERFCLPVEAFFRI